MGSYEDHLLGGTVDIPAGNVKRLRAACEGLAGVGTAANPVTIRLAAGTYTLDRPLTLPSFCTISGAGREATIVQRTLSLFNSAFGTALVNSDPVLECSLKQNITLENLSVIHSGTADSSFSSTTRSPTALYTGGCKRLKMTNVRLEGTVAGWHDKSDMGTTDFTNKPIPSNTIGDEDYQYHLTDCIFIGHQLAGALQPSRHELFATGCTFICHIRSSDVLAASAMPASFNHWEYLVGHYKSCRFVMKCDQTLTVSNATEGACAFAIKDTNITDTIAYCDNCTFELDLGEGDMNSASSGACCVYVGGNNPGGGTLYPANVFRAANCRFIYQTGTITSTPYICGVYLDGQAGTNASVDAYLNSCTFEDLAGSGGTRRRDVVVAGRLGNAQARRLVARNTDVQDFEYRNVTGSPVYTHANFMTEPNTMTYQRGSATFSPSGTSIAVTLPLAFTASAGVTDYFVGLEPSENNTFWVDTKTNSGFTLNAANATAGTIRYVVRR